MEKGLVLTLQEIDSLIIKSGDLYRVLKNGSSDEAKEQARIHLIELNESVDKHDIRLITYFTGRRRTGMSILLKGWAFPLSDEDLKNPFIKNFISKYIKYRNSYERFGLD